MRPLVAFFGPAAPAGAGATASDHRKDAMKSGSDHAGRKPGAARRAAAASCALALALAVFQGCSATRPVARGRLPRQHPADVARIQAEIRPTVGVATPAAPGVPPGAAPAPLRGAPDLLWEAAAGYMTRVLPVDTVSRGSLRIETPVLEWQAGGGPRRTQITVRIVRAARGEARVEAVALDIVPVAQLESDWSGRALDYAWALQGSLPDVEKVIVDQILARQRMLRDGRSPDLVPLQHPLPGLDGGRNRVQVPPGAEGYYRPGSSEGPGGGDR